MDDKHYEYEPQKKSGGKGGLIVAAVVIGVILLLLIGMLVLFGLNFSGRSSGGFGRYEERIETVEESVENWADGVEAKVGDIVESAIDSGFAGFDYHYSGEDSYNIGAAEVETRNVNRLVIDWVAGNVTVELYDGDAISISEPKQEKEKNQLRWRQEGDTLTIRYCASTGSGEVGAKDLTVKIPAELASVLRYVQVSTVSADANVSGLEIGELQFDSTSGSLDASGFYHILDADITSGDVVFVGEIKDVEIDTVSGSVTMNCSETPDELSFDSTSGDLTLLVPERRSFEAEFDTVSGEYRSDYGDIRGDELYYEGTEGGNPAEFDFDTVSGDIRIERAPADKVPVEQ